MAFFNRHGGREHDEGYSDYDQAFRRMLASSRPPRDWYDDEDERGFFPDASGESVEGGKRVHTFRRLEDGSDRFEVVWWNFELKKYIRITVVNSFERARSEVNFLNGGSGR